MLSLGVVLGYGDFGFALDRIDCAGANKNGVGGLPNATLSAFWPLGTFCVLAKYLPLAALGIP